MIPRARLRRDALGVALCAAVALAGCESGELPSRSRTPATATRARGSASSQARAAGPTPTATPAPPAAAKPSYEAKIEAPLPQGIRLLADWPEPQTTFLPTKPGSKPKRRPNGDGCSSTKLIRAHGLLGEDAVQALVKLKAKRMTLQIENLKSHRRLVLEGELEQSYCDKPLQNSARLIVVGRPRTGADAVLLGLSASVGSERLQLDSMLQIEGQQRELNLWDVADDRLEVHRAERELLLRQEGIAADVQAVVELPGRTQLALGLSARGLERAAFFAELEREPARVRATSDTASSCREYACDAMLAAFEVAPGVVLLLPRLNVYPWDGKCTQRVDVEVWTHTSQGLVAGGLLADTIDCAGGIDYPGRGTSTSLFWADLDGMPPLELLSAHSDDGPVSVDIFGYDSKKASYHRLTDKTPNAVLQKLSSQLEAATAFAGY